MKATILSQQQQGLARYYRLSSSLSKLVFQLLLGYNFTHQITNEVINMLKTIKITEQVNLLIENMSLRIESLIISISKSNNLLDKFTTGFGWAQNLVELENEKLISPSKAKEIKETVNYLISVKFRYEIELDEWNEYTVKSRSVINYLSKIA